MIPPGHSIAIASGKGGVGKSTFAVNIAVGLAQRDFQVGLLDADIYGPNIPTMMGIEGMPPQDGDKLKPAEAYGVKVMSIGFLVPAGQPLIWRGPMLHSAIQQFVNDVEWGELDYLIIDLPPGTGDAQLSIAQTISLTGGLIVTLPQKVSLEDARRGLEMFRTMEVPILGIVENMSYLELADGSQMDIFGRGGGESLSETCGTRFLGSVPLDPEIRQGGDEGVPLLIAHPESAAAQAFSSVIEGLLDQMGDQGDQASSDVEIEITD
jgi:ATP-binding protein involved in chromosome partitioning